MGSKRRDPHSFLGQFKKPESPKLSILDSHCPVDHIICSPENKEQLLVTFSQRVASQR